MLFNKGVDYTPTKPFIADTRVLSSTVSILIEMSENSSATKLKTYYIETHESIFGISIIFTIYSALALP